MPHVGRFADATRRWASAADVWLSIVLAAVGVYFFSGLFTPVHFDQERIRVEVESSRLHVTGLFILGLAFLLSMAGTEIGGVGVIVLMSYGLHRGGVAIARGQGAKRFVAGIAVILFSLFAAANYVFSLGSYPSPRRYETTVVGLLRTINIAQVVFVNEKRLDADKNGVAEFGNLEQLAGSGLLEHGLLARAERNGYRLTLVLTGEPAADEKQYFLSAVPLHYGEPPRFRLSLLAAFYPQPPLARRTFATDETTMIRARDLGETRPVTREETQKWDPLD